MISGIHSHTCGSGWTASTVCRSWQSQTWGRGCQLLLPEGWNVGGNLKRRVRVTMRGGGEISTQPSLYTCCTFLDHSITMVPSQLHAANESTTPHTYSTASAWLNISNVLPVMLFILALKLVENAKCAQLVVKLCKYCVIYLSKHWSLSSITMEGLYHKLLNWMGRNLDMP